MAIRQALARSKLIARCLPLIRTFISLPADIARMPLLRFALCRTEGCVPWVLALTLLGDAVGKNWATLRSRLAFLDYAIAWVAVRARRATEALTAGSQEGIRNNPACLSLPRANFAPALEPAALSIPETRSPRQSGCSQVSCGTIAR